MNLYIIFISFLIILILLVHITNPFKKDTFTFEEFKVNTYDPITKENKNSYFSAAKNAIQENSGFMNFDSLDDTLIESYVKNIKNGKKSNLSHTPSHELFDNTEDIPVIPQECSSDSDSFDLSECQDKITKFNNYLEIRKLLQFCRVYALKATLNKCNTLDI
tara:strand:- start:82 stop:567 length:486 start_codon:yes stop_codon:yes gene_type:complete